MNIFCGTVSVLVCALVISSEITSFNNEYQITKLLSDPNLSRVFCLVSIFWNYNRNSLKLK